MINQIDNGINQRKVTPQKRVGFEPPKVQESPNGYTYPKKPAALKITKEQIFEFHSDAFDDSSDDDEDIFMMMMMIDA